MPASDSSGRQTAKAEKESHHGSQEQCMSAPEEFAAGCRSYGCVLSLSVPDDVVAISFSD
jgi:hypothetical protein